MTRNSGHISTLTEVPPISKDKHRALLTTLGWGRTLVYVTHVQQ
jgi:hypothetical protein